MGLEKHGTAVGRKERAGKLGKQPGDTFGSVTLPQKLSSLQAEQGLDRLTKADLCRPGSWEWLS